MTFLVVLMSILGLMMQNTPVGLSGWGMYLIGAAFALVLCLAVNRKEER